MHSEAREYVARHARPSPGLLVLDIGGQDMNGSVRDLWPGADYTAMDITDGPGVDVVADAATWRPDWEPHQGFDVVVCCEVFEHAESWPEIVDTAYRALRPGGLFIVTTAGPGRAPHSGRRALPPEPDPGEHYANVDPGALADVFEVTGFVDWEVSEARGDEDVRAVGRRPQSVHVVTAIYGGYDTKLLGMPHPHRAPAQTLGDAASLTLVTDDPTLGQDSTEYLPGLIYPEVSHVATAPGWEPKHAARWPKFSPAEAVPEVVAPGDVVVWIDGRFEILHPGYVAMAVDALGDADYAAWLHPSVTSMAAQVSACVREQPHKYDRDQLIGHAAARAGETYDGMWQLTTMVTRVNDRTMAAGRDVMEAMAKWPRSIDQLEFPYAAKRHGARVADLPGGQAGFWGHAGTWFRLHPHQDGT
jgi:hypothetical protein